MKEYSHSQWPTVSMDNSWWAPPCWDTGGQRKQDCGLPPEEHQRLHHKGQVCHLCQCGMPYTGVYINCLGPLQAERHPAALKGTVSSSKVHLQQLQRQDSWYHAVSSRQSEMEQTWTMQAPQVTPDAVPDQWVGRHQAHQLLPVRRPQDKKSTVSRPGPHQSFYPVYSFFPSTIRDWNHLATAITSATPVIPKLAWQQPPQTTVNSQNPMPMSPSPCKHI